MTTLPIIGITCYAEPARYTVWDQAAALLPWDYVRQVADAGGQPVLLPPIGDAAAAAERLDGLILAGGGDIDPARYAADQIPTTGYIRKFRDEFEFALAAEALATGLPVLGVCRGLQILNVTLGGTLHQHVPDLTGTTVHSPAPGVFGRVPVLLGDELARLYGTTEIVPPHYHHQSIDRLGDGLTVTATADDGIIEAVTLNDRVRAVQWHPEADEDSPLFADFVRSLPRHGKPKDQQSGHRRRNKGVPSRAARR